ncbi:unnamed protein product [Echinostoma caproni]|uniref:Protein kinase domain-containing protein n=1 Tax=Echinostoma caproni TaxID=27848 RepID=A0A183AWC3_9TREM|nr:unnamed protein product [Echinostoma caproni]
MPDEWLQWLRAANISIHERERNPELVIEVLQCYDAATHHARRQKFIMTHRTDWGCSPARRLTGSRDSNRISSTAQSLSSYMGAEQTGPTDSVSPSGDADGTSVSTSRTDPGLFARLDMNELGRTPPPVPPHCASTCLTSGDSGSVAPNANGVGQTPGTSGAQSTDSLPPSVPAASVDPNNLSLSTECSSGFQDHERITNMEGLLGPAISEDFIDCGSFGSYSNIYYGSIASGPLGGSIAKETCPAPDDLAPSFIEEEPYGVEELDFLSDHATQLALREVGSGKFHTVGRTARLHADKNSVGRD